MYSLYLAVTKNLALGLYPSSIVFYFKKTFRKLALLPSSGKRGEGGTYSVGSLERANFNHWSPCLPEDGSKASFRNDVFKEKTLDDG
jgi:hypothetical protein